MRTTTRKVVSNYKHKRCKTTITKIKIAMTKTIASNCKQERRNGKWQSTCRSRPRRSWLVASIRDARWRPPRPRLLVATTKREQAWSAWASSNLVRELYQQHDCLISKERKYAQNFGRCNWRRRWQWPRVGGKIRISLFLAPITVDWKKLKNLIMFIETKDEHFCALFCSSLWCIQYLWRG
jgi:hypothetical protein